VAPYLIAACTRSDGKKDGHEEVVAIEVNVDAGIAVR
jgi:hypothetical protein